MEGTAVSDRANIDSFSFIQETLPVDVMLSANKQAQLSAAFVQEEGRKQPPSFNKKQLFLLTDDGFAQRLVANLLVLTSLVGFCAIIPPLRELAVTYYFEVQGWMLSVVHRHAWWSILAMLSSSCCAIQLILNIASIGCAGLNTLLGPFRPTFLALTILLQCSSWYVKVMATFEGRQPSTTTTTVGSTLWVMILSLLPEILHCYTITIMTTTLSTRQEKTATATTSISPLQDNTNQKDCNDNTTVFYFKMTSVGCSACMVTVSRVLQNLSFVEKFDASVETNLLTVMVNVMDNNTNNSNRNCDSTTTKSSTGCKGSISSPHFKQQREEQLRKIIMQSLEDAGFPMEPITI